MRTTHFVNSGNVQTAYNETGEGTALVMVHGFTGSKLDFQDQLSWFGQGYRVLAYDQRGHGESGNVTPYTLYGLVADLIGFLDATGIDRCHILGHSLGGMVVMRALLAHPERFHSALLMDTAPYPVSLFDTKTRAQLNTIVQANGCEGLLQGMQGQPQNESVKRLIAYLGETEHWRRVRVKLTQMDADAFVELGAILEDQPSVLESLKTVDLPVTVLAGAEDTPFLQAARDMDAALPNSHLAVIDNAGHSPQYENPDVWRVVVADHLARTKARRKSPAAD